MTVIDIHAHAFPDEIAPAAMEKLASMGDWRPFGDGTISDCLRSMDKAGVEKSAVCGIATKPGQAGGILKWLLDITNRYPGRFLPFASVHPGDSNLDDLFARFDDSGIRAVKLHAFYQDFTADDKIMYPVYESAREHEMLVTFHAGRDTGFEADPEPDRVSPGRIVNVLERYPKMRVLCTHMGGWKMWDQSREKLTKREVWVETSYTMPFMGDDEFRQLVESFAPDRVCFGTDWPWQDRSENLERLRGMGFDEGLMENICRKNALELLG